MVSLEIWSSFAPRHKILVTGLANSADENKIACHKKSFQIKKEVYIYIH